MPISDTLSKICHGDEEPQKLPIVVFIADLITRMDWNPDAFFIHKECGNLCLSIGTKDDLVTTCLQGYNYAYQVKRVMDAIQCRGYFV